MIDDPRDDRALLAAHVAGDPAAFTVLVRRHRDRLWAVALRTTRDREEAADAVQDALLSAFRNAAAYRGDAAVTSWLHRVVVNACFDRMRRRAARPSVALGDTDVPATRDDHAALERRLDLQAALAQLPEAQREAIVLVDIEEIPVVDAARMLGVPEGTIKSRCSRGRVALARILRDATGDAGGGRAERAGRRGNLPTGPRVAPDGDAVTPRGTVGDGPPTRRQIRGQSRGEDGERGHAWTTS